jgi:hypothetical protein
MRFLLAILVYIWLSVTLFGNPLQPILLALFWTQRLAAPYWPKLVALGLVASVLIFLRLRHSIGVVYRPSVLVVLIILVPTVTVGLYADAVRHHAILAFGADEVEEHSFFTSLRKAPQDSSFSCTQRRSRNAPLMLGAIV